MARKIFSNIDFLLYIHLSIEKTLKFRLDHWYPYQLIANIILNSVCYFSFFIILLLISLIFAFQTKDFQGYAQYVKNFDKATELLKSTQDEFFLKLLAVCMSGFE